jgi:hypothetical protein
MDALVMVVAFAFAAPIVWLAFVIIVTIVGALDDWFSILHDHSILLATAVEGAMALGIALVLLWRWFGRERRTTQDAMIVYLRWMLLSENNASLRQYEHHLTEDLDSEYRKWDEGKYEGLPGEAYPPSPFTLIDSVLAKTSWKLNG